MTYEHESSPAIEPDADFWAWVEAELDKPACSFCQWWQSARIVQGQLRPAHCHAMAMLERDPQPPNSYAQACRLYRSVF